MAPGPTSCRWTYGCRCGPTRSSTSPRSPRCSRPPSRWRWSTAARSTSKRRSASTCPSMPTTDGGRSRSGTCWSTRPSGLPAVRRLWELRSVEDRIEAVLSARPAATPGMRFEYSCVGYIVAGLLLERVSGAPLPKLVREYVTGPFGMSDTGFLPTADLAARTAATEYQTYVDRDMVRASVHDENSWSLGGTAGNAGLFSTA